MAVRPYLNSSKLDIKRSSSSTECAQIFHDRSFLLLDARICLHRITGIGLQLAVVLLQACIVLLQSLVDIL